MGTHRSLRIIGLLGIILFCFSSCAGQSRQPTEDFVSIDLDIGEQTLINWYNTSTSHTGNTTYFGAYALQPVGDDLFIGFGAARPAESDGAYFAYFDGTTLNGIGEPDEQGLHDMLWNGSLVHIAGTDPANGDGWETGNHYTYDPNTPGASLEKHRDATNGQINAIHTWGLWDTGSTLYASASGHDGSIPQDCKDQYGVKCYGKIFASTDAGQTWEEKSKLGDYRAYDIIGYNSALYAIHNDELSGKLSMSKSADGGSTWALVSGTSETLRRTRLVEFDEKLIGVHWDRNKLVIIDSNNNATTVNLPDGYLVGATYDEPAYTDYNLLTVTGSNLYLVTESQTSRGSNHYALLRTSDLSSWERMTTTPTKIISLVFWPNKQWIVAATPGSTATLLKFDISGAPTAIELTKLEATPQVEQTSFRFALLLIFALPIWVRFRQR
jgi:hypothetical protein